MEFENRFVTRGARARVEDFIIFAVGATIFRIGNQLDHGISMHHGRY